MINRSLIGRQAVLNTTNDEAPILNATTRPGNRTRGWSEMTSDVVVAKNSITDSNSLRSNQPRTPRRRLALNDGRSGESGRGSSSSTRTRRYNVNHGRASSSSLPPSTAGTRGIDINRVNHRFNVIANSINQLGMSHMSRHTDAMYDCIIKTMQDKSIVERNGCSDELLLIYQNKIDNLIREKDYDQYYQTITQDPIEATVEDDQTEISVSMQD